MLIDNTYFRGPLQIDVDSSGQGATLIALNEFIEIHEPKFLEAVLGYDLTAAFYAGLMDVSIDQRWQNLLGGTGRYKGLVEGLGLVSSLVLNDVMVKVGRGMQYDPISGASSVIIPASLVGKRWDFEQASFGMLYEDDDYSITGNVLTLTGGYIFSNNDKYYYKLRELSVVQNDATVKKSMIANWVYFYWLRNEATQTTGIGEALTKSENSIRTSPANKQRFAWNEMSEMVDGLRVYMSANLSLYPESTGVLCDRKKFGKIYLHGL